MRVINNTSKICWKIPIICTQNWLNHDNGTQLPSDVPEKCIVKTAKKTTNFLDYCALHPYAVTEYRSGATILNIYYDASLLSELEACIKSEGYFFEAREQRT